MKIKYQTALSANQAIIEKKNELSVKRYSTLNDNC